MSTDRVTDRVEGAADDTRRWLEAFSHTESLLLHVAEHEAVASLDESLDSSWTTSESLYGGRPSTGTNTSQLILYRSDFTDYYLLELYLLSGFVLVFAILGFISMSCD